MPKKVITIEVDQAKMFDAVAQMKGDFGPVGERLAGVLLAGESSFSEAIGLAVYGIEISSITDQDEKTVDAEV